MLSATLGGSPRWWLKQDDTMVATGLDVLEKLTERRTT